MRWDAVHDSRKYFRCLLHAQSEPGTPQGPVPRARLVEEELTDAALGLMLTLFDASTTVAAVDKDSLELARMVSRATASTIVEPTDADFVIAYDLVEAVKAARVGTELEPESSATIIGICRDNIVSRAVLEGPGIDGSTTAILPISLAWLAGRLNTVDRRGVDVFLVSGLGVTALPRSTVIAPVT